MHRLEIFVYFATNGHTALQMYITKSSLYKIKISNVFTEGTVTLKLWRVTLRYQVRFFEPLPLLAILPILTFFL